MTELNYRNIDTNLNPTLLNKYDFDYDRLNRITAIESTLDGLSQFTYDLRSQITAANHASPHSDESYSCDDNGNRNSSGYSVGVNNQTTADGAYTYLYDAEGNRTRKTKNSDSSYEEYTWDHRDRLTKVSFKNSGGTEQKYVEYTYDIFNRLVRRKYDPDGSGSTQPTNLYLVAYDGINPTIAMDGTSHTDVSNRFLWGSMVDMLLADELVTSVYQNGNTLWMLSDQVGTVKDIVDYISGAFSIVNHRTIDSFGKITGETNSAIDEVFAYTGKFIDDFGDSDPNTGLSNHWNRWYDPQLGKWVSEDPIGFAGGDDNISRYAGNNALNSIDPVGLQEKGFSDLHPDLAKKVREILTSKGIEKREVELRIAILDNIVNGKAIGTGNIRDPNFWVFRNGNGPFVNDPAKLPTDAIISIWTFPNGGIFCNKYSALIMIKAIIDRADRAKELGFDSGQEVLEKLDSLLDNKEIPNDLPKGLFFDYLEKDEFREDDLLPRDQIWIHNPYFRTGDGDFKERQGEEGSNIFYLGDGLVISIYSGNILTLQQYKQGMLKWATVQLRGRDADPSDFKIKRVRRIKSPASIKEGLGKLGTE